MLEQRACVLSTSGLRSGRAGMCQTQLGRVQGRCWQAQHEAALQGAREWSHLIYALNHVTRRKPEKLTWSCLVTLTGYRQDYLTINSYHNKAITYISFCLCLDFCSFPFSICSLHSLPIFTPNEKLLLDLGHSSHRISAFCLTTRLSQLFHFPFTFPREG